MTYIYLAHDFETAKGRDVTQRLPIFKRNNSLFHQDAWRRSNNQSWKQCYNSSQQPRNSNQNNFQPEKVNNNAFNTTSLPQAHSLLRMQAKISDSIFALFHDDGNTHNFISTRVAHKFKLNMTSTN